MTFESFLRDCLARSPGFRQVRLVPRIDEHGKVAFYAHSQGGPTGETFDGVVEGKHVRWMADVDPSEEDELAGDPPVPSVAAIPFAETHVAAEEAEVAGEPEVATDAIASTIAKDLGLGPDAFVDRGAADETKPLEAPKTFEVDVQPRASGLDPVEPVVMVPMPDDNGVKTVATVADSPLADLGEGRAKEEVE